MNSGGVEFLGLTRRKVTYKSKLNVTFKFIQDKNTAMKS